MVGLWRIKLVCLSALLIFFWSCEDNPSNAESDDATLSQAAQSSIQGSWQVISRRVNQNQVNSILFERGELVDTDPITVKNSKALYQKIDPLMSAVKEMAQPAYSVKGQTDSLIWFQEFTNEGGYSGRRALYYDPVSTIGRLYQAIDEFPAGVRLEYDSLEVQAFLGQLLTNTDDRVLRVDHLGNFESGFFISSVLGNVVATDWDSENEIVGATALNSVTYRPSSIFEQLEENTEWNPDSSGSFSQRLDYRDNTFARREVIFSDNFSGTFSEIWRTGTTVDGRYDALEDDNNARLERNINFANTPFIRRMEQVIEYTQDPTNGSSTGLAIERFLFRNGGLDSARVEVDRYQQNGNWVEDFEIFTSNDGNAAFTVTYFEGFQTVSGEHEAQDGTYSRFQGTEYEDGSGNLRIEVWAAKQDFLNGEPPIIIIDLHYNNDGSGEGTLTEGNQEYRITMNENGEIDVVDSDGGSISLSGY